MSAKEYLQQLSYIKLNIISMNLDIKDLRQMNITSSYSQQISSSTNIDKIHNICEKVGTLEIHLKNEIVKLENLRLEILGKIEKMGNPNEKIILKFRYVNDLAFDEIAVKTNYSKSMVFKLHRKALVSFDNV